jgi:uncharacterized protein DUF5677
VNKAYAERKSRMSDVKECAPQVVGVGYPDFWQHVHDQLPKFFGTASLELVDIGNTAFRGSLSDPLHKIARHLARMTWNSIGSVSLLALNGSGVDAMKIARGMFETSVTLGYLRVHPEQVDDYLDYHCVIQKQRLDFTKEHEPDRLKQLPAQLLQRIEADFARVAPRFQNRKGKLRTSWSKASIREMARDVGKEKLYLTFYRFASSIHHGDVGGAFAQTATLAEDDVLDVEIVPSDAWLTEALIIAHGAVVSVLGDYNEITKAGIDEVVDQAQKSFLATWGKEQPEAS